MKNKKSLSIFISTVIILVAGIGLFISGENQINSQKAQIASLQRTIKSDNYWLNEEANSLKEITGTNNPYYIPPKKSAITPTAQATDPHAGMKEEKGMTCKPQNGDSLDCNSYDYWYNPNAAPVSGQTDIGNGPSIIPLPTAIPLPQ